MRQQRILAISLMAALTLAPVAALAKKKPDTSWSASRTSDPVTGETRCVIAAFDRGAGLRFSRTGYLYPLVEMHPVHGLLVGVSSGGRFRLPTGDILWRVDDRPYRELKAANNPPSSGMSFAMPVSASGVDAASRAMRDTVEQALRLSAGLAATSTVASGDKAKSMLAEMLSGHNLVFRAAAAVPNYGLPSSRTYEVGQFTAKGLRPFPLDESFHKGLDACGIGAGGPAGTSPAAYGEPASESP